MCRPVREGQSTTLSCAAYTVGCRNDTFFTWKAGKQVVARCVPQGCDAAYSGFSATYSSVADSTLTINNVSRTDPFDMEVNWACKKCRDVEVYECSKLEIYGEFPHSTHFFFNFYNPFSFFSLFYY